jgi:hypothetical protein
MDEQRVKHLGDLLLIGKVQGSVVRIRNALLVHGANLDDVSNLFTLQNTISSTTGHTSYIQQLGSVNHVVILASSNANTSSLDLEAQAALVLPQRSGDTGLHAWRGLLAGSIKTLVTALHRALGANAGQRKHVLSTHRV